MRVTPAESARALAALSTLLGPFGWLPAAFWLQVATRAEGTSAAPGAIPGWRRPIQPPHPIVRR